LSELVFSRHTPTSTTPPHSQRVLSRQLHEQLKNHRDLKRTGNFIQSCQLETTELSEHSHHFQRNIVPFYFIDLLSALVSIFPRFNCSQSQTGTGDEGVAAQQYSSLAVFIFMKLAQFSHRWHKRFIYVTVYCYFAVYVFMSLSLIPQVLDIVLPLNESRPILSTYPGYYFVDERKYFFYIFSHAIMAWEIAMTGIVTHDCMLLTYIEHVCSIFTLVG